MEITCAVARVFSAIAQERSAPARRSELAAAEAQAQHQGRHDLVFVHLTHPSTRSLAPAASICSCSLVKRQSWWVEGISQVLPAISPIPEESVGISCFSLFIRSSAGKSDSIVRFLLRPTVSLPALATYSASQSGNALSERVAPHRTSPLSGQP